MKRIPCFLFTLLLAANSVWADSVEPPDGDDSVAAELKSFQMADGFTVSLFASEENEIANPITMRWDARGRLWVLCSLVYPQIVPSEKPEDRLFILEDSDGDGRADSTKVFADNLNMPTGFALGDGGVYLGEGPDLVFWRDTDGDDRGDTRELVLSGFGTGDTHQNINSFTWSPGGELFFCQGLHGFARVETPWGIVGMDQHGVWRLRPRTRQLHAFRGGSSQNPWGVAFGDWGEPLVKGGSGTGLSELLPIMVPTEHFHDPVDIGNTAIKSMIVTYADSPHLPDALRGDVLIAGYFGHTIDRMRIEPDGAGHRAVNMPPLLRSSHRSFRPVDIQIGPDGAIYVADWYNPIIGHYQASFRHPDRDKAHGRIWRITANARPLAERPELVGRSVGDLLNVLKSPVRYEREQARQLLSGIPTPEVVAALESWCEGLDPSSPDDLHALYEALGIAEWHEHVDRDLLEKLLMSGNPLARASAVRVAGRWADRIDEAAEILGAAINDPHPRVRLEAVVASSYLKDPGAIGIALRALDHPMDRFLQAALVQTCHALKPLWWPAFTEGSLRIANPQHLAFALQEAGGIDAVGAVRGMLADATLSPQVADSLLALLAVIGGAEDMDYVLARAGGNAAVLAALADAMAFREIAPTKDPSGELSRAMASGDPSIAAPALRLAGLWGVEALGDEAARIAGDPALGTALRAAAVQAVARLRGAAVAETLADLAVRDKALPVAAAAMDVLADLDLSRAATVAVERLRADGLPSMVGALVTPFFRRVEGLAALATALKGVDLAEETRIAILETVHAAGVSSETLTGVLELTGAGDGVGFPAFDQEFVNRLAEDVTRNGDAAAGREVYHSARATCVACHRIGIDGGILGPELSAVGAGLPVELLVEAVLWPARQVKEGYLSTSLRLATGKVLNGYLQSGDADPLVIRDAASGLTETVPLSRVAERKDAGTLMPPGLAASMTRKELVDLIRYLSDLKGGG